MVWAILFTMLSSSCAQWLECIMPYNGLHSRDLYILDLQWRSRCAHYFLWILPLCALVLCSMTHYDITMDYDVAKDAPLWHHSG